MTQTGKEQSLGDNSELILSACNIKTMSFTVEVLRKEAAKCQRKTLHKYKIALEKASRLEELLHDVCLVLLPKPSDYDARRDLIRIFNEIIMEIFGCSRDIPRVVEFGSFSMDLFVAESDLDLSVNLSNVDIPRDKKIQILRKLAKKLYLLQRSGHVHGVKPITTAKVPVLKVVDSGTGIECDISVGNKDGILKSKILYFISLIDERFRKLCFLMKAWAKAHNINSAKDRTLNSLTIILLVAFHLQTRNHPILPPFSAILRDGCDAGAVAKSIHKFVNYGQNNTESVAELFLTLLLMLSSVDELWSQGLCVSTYDGSWISKTWGHKAGCISVEDFTDRSQNVARAVGEREMKRIYESINLSIERISDFFSCRMEGYALREFLFGKDVATLVGEVTMNCNANVAKSNVPPGSTTWIEHNDAIGGHKATQQPRHVEHRGQSAQPSPYNTALGKRMRTDGSSVPSTRLVGKPLVDGRMERQRYHQSAQPSPHLTALGKRTRTDGSSLPSTRLVGKPLIDGRMERQRSMPYDMARREPMENCGGMPLVGPGGTQHSWGRAEQTIPVDPINTKRMRNTGAFGNMHYSETDRAPYLPIPIARPTYASNIGNWMSSGHVRESDIATTLATPMVYPSYPRDQHRMTFRAPTLPTPSVYPTFPPIVNQMFSSHASETSRVANLPSASDVLGYPLAGSNLFCSPNSSFP